MSFVRRVRVQGGIPVCAANLNQCTESLTECDDTLTTCTIELTTAQDCGNGVIDSGEDCDQSNLNEHTCATQGFVGGVLNCGAGCSFDTSGCHSERFHDNGDGTVTDHKTGLMWEKKTGIVGNPVQCTSSGGGCPDAHNVNNTYAWNGYDQNTETSVSAQYASGMVFSDSFVQAQ
jgi:hypothetical protein